MNWVINEIPIWSAKYYIMNKTSPKLDDVFDESVQYKIQFVRTNGKLKMVRRKVTPAEIKEPEKQLFPISKERS
jgi:hypothetical protein